MGSWTLGLEDPEKGSRLQESVAEGGWPLQGSQAETNGAWRGHVFSVWLSGLITAQSIRLATTSPQFARQSQAAGCGVFPLDRSYAAWLIPCTGPRRALGLERPLEAGRNAERGSGILPSYHTSFLKSTARALEVHSRNTCLGSPDTRSLWPPASQPSALPQRGRNEGTVAWTHSPALSRTFYRLSSCRCIFGDRCSCLKIIRIEAPVFSETLGRTQVSHPALYGHFSLHFWRNWALEETSIVRAWLGARFLVGM